MLDMRLREVLRETWVFNSNLVDFFRLSPMGIMEHSNGGTLVARHNIHGDAASSISDNGSNNTNTVGGIR